AYDPARAYGSFQAAYSAASGGDTIRVKAGAYGNQDITSDNGDLSSMVTFQAAAGETVTMNRLTTDVDWITVKDMEITAAAKDGRGWYSHGHHVTLDHVYSSGAEAVAAIGGSDVSYLNAGLGTRGNTTARRCSFN